MGEAYGQQGSAAPTAGVADDLIKDTTTQTFMQDVIEASRNQPVLVDFWAPWCQPCKQITPVLEGAVKAAKGAVKLVKMNIEDYPEIAGQMGVQSIPAVVAFKNGQPVDGFMGAQPESQIKAFIERLGVKVGPSDTEQLLSAALEQREAGNYAEAVQIYASLLGIEPDNDQAICGLVMCYVAAGEIEAAKQTLDAVPADKQNTEHYAAAKAAIDLAGQAEELDDLAELRAKVAADPGDHQAQLDLAVGLNARGDKQEAVDVLVASIRADRAWNDEACKKQLLQFFEAWGFKDAASVYGRRKLSALLFA